MSVAQQQQEKYSLHASKNLFFAKTHYCHMSGIIVRLLFEIKWLSKHCHCSTVKSMHAVFLSYFLLIFSIK